MGGRLGTPAPDTRGEERGLGVRVDQGRSRRASMNRHAAERA